MNPLFRHLVRANSAILANSDSKVSSAFCPIKVWVDGETIGVSSDVLIGGIEADVDCKFES